MRSGENWVFPWVLRVPATFCKTIFYGFFSLCMQTGDYTVECQNPREKILRKSKVGAPSLRFDLRGTTRLQRSYRERGTDMDLTLSSRCSGAMKARLPFRLAAAFVVSFFFLVGLYARAESATNPIKLDQVGYLPDSPKVALVSGSRGSSESQQSFTVNRASDGVIVFRGKLSAASHDPSTSDDVRVADFSPLHQSGRYYVEASGGRRWGFSSEPCVYSRAYYLAMRAFYGQRCGTAVDLGPEFSGYTHPSCHLKGEFHASSGRSGERDNVGGWHDAGDYGRDVGNSRISTGSLLWAWELYGSKLKHIKLNIPESGTGTPDILNEIRWNLEWMLKMQDDDGGVWHKQTSEHFSGFVMPEDDKLPSEIVGTGSAPYKSTCATADLAAVAAVAARVYQPFDAKFALRNLEAARKAWQWAEKNPDVVFRHP